MGSITVVVADDDATMRDTLTAMLLTDPRFDVVGQASSGPELVALVATARPHVALIDVRMPGGGAEALRALAEGPPVVPIMVSAETAPSTLISMLRGGARGYLTKGRIGPCLPDLVARCTYGEVVLASPTGAETLRQLLSVRVP
jgi:DNA-binding NarL/FixJ family response regulator